MFLFIRDHAEDYIKHAACKNSKGIRFLVGKIKGNISFTQFRGHVMCIKW